MSALVTSGKHRIVPTRPLRDKANCLHRISDVTAIIKQAAAEAGFDLSGIAPAADASELKYFPEWIAAGHGGEMNYLQARDEQGS